MNVEKYHAKAVELLKAGKYTEALEVLNQSIEQFKNNADLISERAVVYLHLGKKKESLKDMDTAVDLEPQKSYRYSSRAYAKSFFGDNISAVEDYKKAIALDPEDDIAHNNLGLLEEKLGYMQQASENFRKADELNGKRLGNEQIGGRKQINSENLKMDSQKIEARNIQKEIDEEIENKPSYFQQVFSIFTSKKERDSFVEFVKSGFKIKDE